MRGREEPTSPQGVANLMTADWLCMEHTDGVGCPLTRAHRRAKAGAPALASTMARGCL